ncbi:MAG: phosphoglucomutase [Bacteroides sp.]|jgi:phosphomannomutase|nr:phosphoglucomutase [Bacteroides sp.]
MAHKIVFGTDGWRGLLDEELNLENIRRVAQAFSLYLLRKTNKPKVAVGFDGRRNSDLFALEFSKVLIANGIVAILSNRIIPTPVLSFYTHQNDCNAGVMITASHNPPEYNGLKFKTSAGAPFSLEETALVEGLIDSEQPSVKDCHPLEIDFSELYINHIEKNIDLKRIASSGLSLLTDSMGGAGMRLIKDICLKNGVNCKSIFCKPATDFYKRIPEPIEKNLQPLSDELKKGNFSIGFATDGDADRLGIMDENGNWVNIQEVILFFSEYMVEKFGQLGGLVKTSSVTEKVSSLQADDLPVKVHDVQVGFKYVSEAMVKNGAVFGAEESGGFGFFNHLPDRDGIFSAFMFLQMLTDSGENKLSDFLKRKRKEFGEVCYSRIDVKTTNTERHLILPFIERMPPLKVFRFRVLEIKTFKNSRGITNGLKFRLEGNPRWLLIRISETEPMARVYAEGESMEEVNSLLFAGKQLFI